MALPPLDRVADLLHTAQLRTDDKQIREGFARLVQDNVILLSQEVFKAKEILLRAVEAKTPDDAIPALQDASRPLALTILHAFHLMQYCSVKLGRPLRESRQDAYEHINVLVNDRLEGREEAAAPPPPMPLFEGAQPEGDAGDPGQEEPGAAGSEQPGEAAAAEHVGANYD